MSKKIFVALSALSLSLLFAAGSRVRAEERWEAPCKPDSEKFCKGEKEMRACLTKHEDELVPDCKKQVRNANVLEACNDDFEKLCKEERASGQLSKCINDKKAQLSEKCRGVLDRTAVVKTVETVTVTKPAPKKKGKATKKKE